MIKAKVLKFAKEWSKLKDSFFLTVRWTDTVYIPHQIYPVAIKGKIKFYGKVLFTINVKLKDILYDAFTIYDADCTALEYYQMMKNWYGNKEKWKNENSIVQMVGIRKCKGKGLADFGKPS